MFALGSDIPCWWPRLARSAALGLYLCWWWLPACAVASCAACRSATSTWTGGLVHVAFNYVVRGGQRVRKDTKTHQDRWLAIDPATCALIANYLDEIRVALAAVGVGLRDDAYLFSNDPVNARPWNPDWVTHQITAAADAAGWNSTSRAGGITPLASSWPAASTCTIPPPGSAAAGAARPRWGTTPTRFWRLTDEPPYISRSRSPDLLCHHLSLDLAVRHGWAELARMLDVPEGTEGMRRLRVTGPQTEPPFQINDSWIHPRGVADAPEVAGQEPGPGGWLYRLEAAGHGPSPGPSATARGCPPRTKPTCCKSR